MHSVACAIARRLSVRQPVCSSMTFVYCIEMAINIFSNVFTILHGSPTIPVFNYEILWRNSGGVSLTNAAVVWKMQYLIFSQPSIYIDGWLYGMSMTSVVCNVPVLSQNDSTYHHSVSTTWKWHPFATWTPSFIILVWGHHPLIGATVFPASRTLVKRIEP